MKLFLWGNLREIERGEKMETKKYVLIVKEELIYGIELIVDLDFDPDHDSQIIKDLVRDYPTSSRRRIMGGSEILVSNEGDDIKVNPQYYLNKSGHLENLLWFFLFQSIKWLQNMTDFSHFYHSFGFKQK